MSVLLLLMTVNADCKGNLLSLLQCIHGNVQLLWLCMAEHGGRFGHGAEDLGTAVSCVRLFPDLGTAVYLCWPVYIYVLLGTAALEQLCAG